MSESWWERLFSDWIVKPECALYVILVLLGFLVGTWRDRQAVGEYLFNLVFVVLVLIVLFAIVLIIRELFGKND